MVEPPRPEDLRITDDLRLEINVIPRTSLPQSTSHPEPLPPPDHLPCNYQPGHLWSTCCSHSPTGPLTAGHPARALVVVVVVRWPLWWWPLLLLLLLLCAEWRRLSEVEPVLA